MDNKEKNRRGFWIKEIQSAPSWEVRRITRSERWETSSRLPITCVKHWLLSSVVNCYLSSVVKKSINVFCWTSEYSFRTYHDIPLHIFFFFLFFFFFSWRKSARTPGHFGGRGEWRGSAGLQPTKTSTMTDPAAIEGGPGTGASDTTGHTTSYLSSTFVAHILNVVCAFFAYDLFCDINNNYYFYFFATIQLATFSHFWRWRWQKWSVRSLANVFLVFSS